LEVESSVPVWSVAKALKDQIARLRQQNERLQRENRHLMKQIECLKAMHVQGKASEIPFQPMGDFHLYWKRFQEPMGQAGLRTCLGAIQRSDPKAVVCLADAEGCLVVGLAEEPQRKGISAKQLLAFWIDRLGGAGGGGDRLAQGRIDRLEDFSWDSFKAFFEEKER